MQVLSLPLSGLPTPPGLQTRGQDTGGQDADPSLRRSHQYRMPQEAVGTPDEAMRITLTANTDAQQIDQTLVNTAPGAVYAEIWKDGVRIAAVHTNGAITPSFGLNWLPMAGNDIGVAQRRANELARAVGGEVRYASLGRPNETMPPPVDARTERMRAKLRAAYGI